MSCMRAAKCCARTLAVAGLPASKNTRSSLPHDIARALPRCRRRRRATMGCRGHTLYRLASHMFGLSWDAWKASTNCSTRMRTACMTKLTREHSDVWIKFWVNYEFIKNQLIQECDFIHLVHLLHLCMHLRLFYTSHPSGKDRQGSKTSMIGE